MTIKAIVFMIFVVAFLLGGFIYCLYLSAKRK